MSYDELSKVVNDAYRENPDIRIRTSGLLDRLHLNTKGIQKFLIR